MKNIILYTCLLICSQTVLAQNNKEKIESYRVAYFTQKLSLTPAEAQQFWPVYNEYRAKLDELRKQKHDELRVKGGNNSLNDLEKEALIDHQIEYKQQELDLQKNYTNRFKQVLPIDKVGKLYLVEESFKKELLDKIRNQQH